MRWGRCWTRIGGSKKRWFSTKDTKEQEEETLFSIFVFLRVLRGHHSFTVANAIRAAAMVLSIASSLCASPTNHASYWLGGRNTPFSSMALKKVLYALVSDDVASLKLITVLPAERVKKGVIMLPTRLIAMRTPVSFAASSRPFSSRAVRSSSVS